MIAARIKARGDGCGYVMDDIITRDGYEIKVRRWFCVKNGEIVYPIRSSMFMDVFSWAVAYEVN